MKGEEAALYTKKIADLVAADGALFALWDDARGELSVMASLGLEKKGLKARVRAGDGVLGQVAEDREPRLVEEWSDDGVPLLASGQRPGAVAVVPLIWQDEFLGLLALFRKPGVTFRSEELSEMETFAEFVAAKVSDAISQSRTEESARQAMALYEVARASYERKDPKEIAEQLVAMVSDYLNASAVAVWELVLPAHQLKYRAGVGHVWDAVRERILPVGQGLLGVVLDSGRPRLASTFELGEVLGGTFAASAESGSFVISPLRTDSHNLGILITGRPRGSPFSPEDLDFCSALSHQVALVLENSALSSRIGEESIEGERNRIAQELHDGPAQKLTGLVLELEASSRLLSRDPEKAREQLVRATENARECLADVRNFMVRLRTGEQEETGLVPLLKRVASDFQKQTQIPCRLVIRGDEGEIAPLVGRTLPRILQECLANVRKHARATSVSVDLDFGDREVELAVADDGVGFVPERLVNTAPLEGKFGILGMKERAVEVGGEIDISSSPGKGTKVVVRLPRKPAIIRPGEARVEEAVATEEAAREREEALPVGNVQEKPKGLLAKLFDWLREKPEEE